MHLTTFWFSRNHLFLGKFYGGTDRGPLNGSTKLNKISTFSHLFVASFVHSFILLFARLFVRPFVHCLVFNSSFVHSLNPWPSIVRSCIRSFRRSSLAHSFGRPFFHSQVVILCFFRLYVSGLISFFSLVVCSFIVLRFVRLFHYWCSFFIRSSIDFF